MDFTAIPKTQRFSYLLVFVDIFTGWFEAFPTRTERATVQFSSVQLLSCVLLFVTPWTTARQASLSITNSQSLLKRMSTESVMPSNHLKLCHPLLLPPSIFPSIRVNESVLRIRWPKIGVSASALVFPMNIQDLFPLGWTGWTSLQSKGFSSLLQHHSSKASILWHSAFFVVQLSHP